MALISKMNRGTPKYEMAEVRYLILLLLKELMQTPLVGFEKQKTDMRSAISRKKEPRDSKHKIWLEQTKNS